MHYEALSPVVRPNPRSRTPILLPTNPHLSFVVSGYKTISLSVTVNTLHMRIKRVQWVMLERT
jgi:hypothetical protein